MPSSTATTGKTQHFGFIVADGKIVLTDGAASADTALARAARVAEKRGLGVVPTFVVEASDRAEAREVAQATWDLADGVEDAAAGETDGAEAHVEVAKAVVAVADSKPKRGTKTGFYTVGLRDGEAYASPVPHRDAATALGVAFDGDGETVMAIKARSATEAVNRYESLGGVLPEGRTIATVTRGERSATPRKRKEIAPVEGATLDQWVPVEAKNGKYFVSRSGILHSSKDCRFVTDKALPLTDKTKTAVETVLANRGDAATLGNLPKSDGGKVTATRTCASCSGHAVSAGEATAAA